MQAGLGTCTVKAELAMCIQRTKVSRDSLKKKTKPKNITRIKKKKENKVGEIKERKKKTERKKKEKKEEEEKVTA